MAYRCNECGQPVLAEDEDLETLLAAEAEEDERRNAWQREWQAKFDAAAQKNQQIMKALEKGKANPDR